MPITALQTAGVTIRSAARLMMLDLLTSSRLHQSHCDAAVWAAGGCVCAFECWSGTPVASLWASDMQMHMSAGGLRQSLCHVRGDVLMIWTA